MSQDDKARLAYLVAMLEGLVAKGDLCKRVDWQAEIEALIEEVRRDGRE